MKKNINKVAVTGAAGLIGSAVTRLLLQRGTQVLALDDFTIGCWEKEDEGITWARSDISAPTLKDILEEHRPDGVIHCAAHPGGKSLKEPVLDVQVNALGSMRIFDWCARSQTPVVYLSSSAIYGEQPPGPIPETAPLHPGTVYATCKVANEQNLKILEKGYGLPWTVLRLFATYGAGHTPSTFQGILNIMLTQLRAGDRVIVKGALDRERDMVYVEDSAAAIVTAMFTEESRGRIINVGTGTGVRIDTLIGLLGQALGKDMSAVEIIEEAGTVGDPKYSVADVSLAKELLGFTARYDIQKGIDSLLKPCAAS